MVSEQLDEEAIFQIARRIDSSDARMEYLRNACRGDQGLLDRVMTLLRTFAENESFLESPPPGIDATIPTNAVSEGPGTVVGPYKLLQQIGEGGMGVVFMAEQSAPIQRTVALKIIKPGMDSRQVIARFEAERQALAMMDHPNIARVIDAGTTESGRPYFVMELVKGVPITKYCDEEHLSLRERLELFRPVCHSVQHAHQKGIIHRDIKPTNVLVADYDNRAVPKVIDFGVAKATAQKLTDQTMFTEFGQVIGTVEYMSPEQAKLNQLDVDTRSDIYSLGVLLYELLTGSTPFEQKRLREAAFDEVLRIIREEEPPKPSTKLSASEMLPSIAANRHTEPIRLSKEVRGELDWIVMKALEKDRHRRYATANDFAADIERHLSDKPVQAGPPSAAYRLRKFARRNKAAVLLTSVIVASLIGATTVSIWQAAIARDALELAESRLESESRARQDANAANEQAKNEATRAAAEAEKAITSAQTAQAVIDFLNWDLLGRANYDQSRDKQNRADGGLSLRAALDRAAERLEGRFADRPQVEAAIRHMIGYTYSQFGDEFYAQAEPYLRRAFELRRIHLGENHLETIRSLMVLAYVRRDVQLQRNAVAHSRRGLGDDHELTQWCKFHLALGLMWTGQNAEAISLFRDVLSAKRTTLGSQHPDTAWLAYLLAVAEGASGIEPADDPELESLYREALSVYLQSGEDWSWRTSDVALRFGQFLKSRGRLEEAAKTLQEAYLRLESVSANVEWALPLVFEIEALYEEWGKPDQLAIWRQKKEVVGQNTLARYAHLRRENPNDPGLAISYASLLAQLGRQQEAEAACGDAIELQPGNPRARHLLGDCLEKQGQYAAAEAAYREAIRLARDNPFDSDLRHRGLGIALFRQSRLVEAEAEFREAIRLRPDAAWNHHWLGDALKELKRWEEAEAAYRVAIGLDTSNTGRYVNLADAMAAAGKSAEAAKELQTAVERHPTSAVWQRSLGHFLLHTMHDPDKALPVLEVAVRLDPDDRHAQYDIGNAFAVIGQWEKAIPAFRRRVDLEPGGEPEARYRLAALCLYTGDIDGYRTICRDMIARYGTSTDPHFVDCTAKICLLMPDVDENRDRALALAELNVKHTEKHRDYRWFVLAQGLADYRAGRFAEAVRRIEQCTPDAEGKHSDATGFTILAMAQHGLGQGEQARSALLSARKILSNNMPTPEKARPFGDDWPDWLHSQILIREAEELIEIQSNESKRTKAAD